MTHESKGSVKNSLKKVIVEHCDIIKPNFWEAHPSILDENLPIFWSIGQKWSYQHESSQKLPLPLFLYSLCIWSYWQPVFRSSWKSEIEIIAKEKLCYTPALLWCEISDLWSLENLKRWQSLDVFNRNSGYLFIVGDHKIVDQCIKLLISAVDILKNKKKIIFLPFSYIV